MSDIIKQAEEVMALLNRTEKAEERQRELKEITFRTIHGIDGSKKLTENQKAQLNAGNPVWSTKAGGWEWVIVTGRAEV